MWFRVHLTMWTRCCASIVCTVKTSRPALTHYRRYGLEIVDLDTPFAPPRHLPYGTLEEPPDVQWSPFASQPYRIVSVDGWHAIVWNVGHAKATESVDFILRGHTDNITDINFSLHEPEILATTSMDSFVRVWDLRRPAAVALSFADFHSGGTQVKWNQQDRHVLASAHDKYIKIWDCRKGNTPLMKIDAHSTKVYGVDWDKVNTSQVATSSLDRTIKIWDYKNALAVPQKVIHTGFPVWRARYTPFGHGILAIAQSESHFLHLYDLTRVLEEGEVAKPVHRFAGHAARVNEFLWRARGTVNNEADLRDYQLVSWGKDQQLRLHDLDEETLVEVGYVKGMAAKCTTALTRQRPKYQSFRDEPVKTNNRASDSDFPRHVFHEEAGISGLHAARTNRYGRRELTGGEPGQKLTSALAWMQGVKLGKRVGPNSSGEDRASKPLYDEGSSGESYESLGEETTASTVLFPKLPPDEVKRRHLLSSQHFKHS